MLGRPLALWAIDALTKAGCGPILVAVPQALMNGSAGRLLAEADSDVRLVAGGSSRQASVGAALQDVTAELVVVHDAVRPLVEPELVARVLRPLERADGAIAALPADDTMKSVAGERVTATVGREDVWHAQTPQAFRTEALRAAHATARTEGVHATDDAQLLERYGATVVVVRGSRTNIKVTYPEDFVMAEAILRSRS